MRDWKQLLSVRLDALKLPPARQIEIVEELAQHLEDRATELTAGGQDPAHAARLALAELTDQDLLVRGLDRLRQAHATEPVTPGAPRRRWLADLWQDLRYGARALWVSRGFSFAAVLTLTLGIGANTAIFSLINSVLLRPFPYTDAASLVWVSNGASPGAVFSYPETVELREKNDVLAGAVVWGGITASFNADGDTDQVQGLIVSGNYFNELGIGAEHGRVLAPTDDVTPSAHPVVAISYRLWQTRFAGRADIQGHEILLNGHRFTIVGVVDRGFRPPDTTARDIFVPMMMQAVARPPRAGFAGEMNPDLLRTRGNRWVYVVGRLKAGVTPEQAALSLSAMFTSLDREGQPTSQERRISTFPVTDGVPGQRAQVVPVATLLMSTVGVVLLIACANVANLLLSRAAARRREVALRLALGASRWRLIRQFLTESVLLATVGGAGGVALAYGIAALFRAMPPPAGALPMALDFTIDARTLGFTLLLSVLTGIVFGLAPAIRASKPSLVPALKDDAFVPDERSRRVNLRKALVVVEVALSLILLVAAGLFVRSLRQTQAVDTGYAVDRLINAPLNVNLLRYTTAQGQEFYRRVVEQSARIPGVESAAVARVAVFGGGRVSSLTVEGRSSASDIFQSTGGGIVAGDNRDRVNSNVIGPGYFRTMGLSLLRGREFADSDTPQAPRVVIVNQAFVAAHLPDAEPLGHRIRFGADNSPWHTIVGVVTDSKYASMSEPFGPIAFVALSQNHETGMTLHVRTAGTPEPLIPAIRREIQSIEPNLPLPVVQTMADTIGTSLYPARMGAWLIGVLGGLALLLAAIGVYGVLAFSIARRTRELGIRMALGADRRDILRLVLGEGVGLVGLGIALGLGVALFGATPLARFLYGVGTHDLWSFSAAAIVLLVIAVVACLIPARRATRVAPTVALKT
jgi:predicted permease